MKRLRAADWVVVGTLVLLTVAFLVILLTNADRWLDRQPAFNTGANLIQWMSAPATVAAVAAYLRFRRHP